MDFEREIVKYDNTINSLKFKSFTQKDFDFFWMICSQVLEKGTQEVSLSFEKIRELTNYKETDRGRMKEDLYRMLQKLLRVVYKYEDEKVLMMFNLFSKFQVLKDEDELQVRVTEEFLPLLNNLENKFTSFELRELVSLNSKHSKTLYRILKQWKTQGRTQEFALEEAKELFDSASSSTKDFQQKVLRLAVDEINEKGYFKNVKMEIERSHKRGRPIKSIAFSFCSEDVKKKVPAFVKEKLNADKQENETSTFKTGSDESTRHKLFPRSTFHNFPQRNYTKEEFAELELKLRKKSLEMD